jgi:hypothetical protein
MHINEKRPVSENVIGEGKEGSLPDQWLGGLQESKPIHVGKRGGKAVEREGQGRCSGRTSIASKALLPTETPMGALSSRGQVFGHVGHWLWRG